MKAVHIESELAQRPVLRGRRPDTPEAEAGKAFATLAAFGEGGLFAGSFAGESAWERHPNGDELVHVLAGETRLTVLTDEGREVLVMTAGMLTVVPQGCWHRFQAPEGGDGAHRDPPADRPLDGRGPAPGGVRRRRKAGGVRRALGT